MDGLRCIDSYTRVCLNRSQAQITIDLFHQKKREHIIAPALNSQKKNPANQNTLLTHIKPVLNLQTKNHH